MKTLIPILVDLDLAATVISFVIAFAAHIRLQFCLDFQRAAQATGRAGWRAIGNIVAPIECYRPGAARSWRIRDIGFKGFAIGFGVFMLVAVGAAIADVPLQ